MSSNGTKINVAVLQEQVRRIDENVEKILSNHLPHIQGEIDSIRVQMAYYAGGIATVTVIASYIINMITK